MRFLYALLCVLLIAWAAFGQAPAQFPVSKRSAPPQRPAAPVAVQVEAQQFTVCQNGKCSVVSSPTGFAQSATVAGCSSEPVAREGWRPGKLLKKALGR